MGIVLLFMNLRKLPVKDGLIIFLFASYIAVILGTIAVEEGMLYYPVKFLERKHFDSNLLFEMLILPVICLYFYRTTFQSKRFPILIQSILYSAVLTTFEFFLERYTPLIEYLKWTWVHTFISVFLFLILMRVFIGLINRKE